jgi:ABC-type methionine transport system ATPase subunit
VVFMSDGRLIEEGEPETFFLHPREPRTRQFLSRILSHEAGVGREAGSRTRRMNAS